MYCNKCGYKLKAKDKVCQNCGEPIRFAEYCGGFWGLVGEENRLPKKEDYEEDFETKSEEPVVERKIYIKKKKKGYLAIAIPLFVLCVVCLLMLVTSSKKKNKYDDLKNEKESIEAVKESLETELAEMDQHIENLESENEQLKLELSEETSDETSEENLESERDEYGDDVNSIEEDEMNGLDYNE